MGALYREIELPVLAPVLAMTLGGVRVNREVLEGIKASSEAQMEIARRQLQELAGRAINLDSAPELIHYLYEELGLPVPAYTANGNPSTSNKALQALADTHPAVPAILAYQQHKPARDAAISLLSHLEPTGLVHAELDPLGAATGRFSCSNPNLQGLAAPVRAAIEAAPGCVLLEADYSQMELRVLAHFSQDAALLHAFQHDIDLLVRTAARVLGVAEADVTAQQRQLGKTLNFGIVYGQTAYGLADELGVPMEEAEAHLAAHAAAYPGIVAWIAEVHQQALNYGEVRTLYGRRRYLPNIYSALPADAAEARRHAVNTVIQGTAADLMKLALVRLNAELPDGVRMLLPVHDSLLCEVPAELVDETRQIVIAAMEAVPKGFSVPLKVGVKLGKTRASCK
jgi:DNA polymerase-1